MQSELSTQPLAAVRHGEGQSVISVDPLCRSGLRGLFSKDCLNRGSVQNWGQVVIKPWHHRREAEGGRVMLLFRW